MTETKQDVRPYTQCVTDEPFLNRVLFAEKVLPNLNGPRSPHPQPEPIGPSPRTPR